MFGGCTTSGLPQSWSSSSPPGQSLLRSHTWSLGRQWPSLQRNVCLAESLHDPLPGPISASPTRRVKRERERLGGGSEREKRKDGTGETREQPDVVDRRVGRDLLALGELELQPERLVDPADAVRERAPPETGRVASHTAVSAPTRPPAIPHGPGRFDDPPLMRRSCHDHAAPADSSPARLSL